MPELIFRRAEHLNQDKTGGVIDLLGYLEAGDAWFLDAVSRILQTGLGECLHELGFDMDLDLHDEHGGLAAG
jgi:hypothetical protein